jgi:CRP/FNR family transcriptional regulator, dissimilatory nitrate respiration regulator
VARYGDAGTPEVRRVPGLDVEEWSLLRMLPLFRGLPEKTVAEALSEASVQRVARNTVLFIHGQPAERFYVVLEGWVKLFRETLDGQESVIAVFTRGESFAEAAMARLKSYPVSAAAATDARLLTVPNRMFMAAVERDKALTMNLMDAMSMHLHGLVGQVEDLAAKSTTERLAAFLVRLCAARTGSTRIQLPFDKTLIAGRLGMQPETLSRAFRKLGAVGVKVAGHEVSISDIAALHTFGEGEH